MKKRLAPYLLLLSAVFCLTSCQAIAGIFKAGVWSGIIVVVVVIAIIIWIVSKFMGGNKD